MPPLPLPDSPLPGLRTVLLTVPEAPRLQAFFDRHPAYFLATSGVPAGPHEALEEIGDLPPADFTFSEKLVIGYVDAAGELAAMANVVTDLLARSVFHLGTFIVATERHGSGDAQRLHCGLLAWAVGHGAAWMRLGVVAGNTRAERFWAAEGYLPLRERPGIVFGPRTATVRNLVKPLAGGTLDAYLELVPRDRPEASVAARPVPR